MRRECRERIPRHRFQTASYRSRHASRHVRDARAVMHVGIDNPRWRGKRSRHSRRMRNSLFYPIWQEAHDANAETQVPRPVWIYKTIMRQTRIKVYQTCCKRHSLERNVCLSVEISIYFITYRLHLSELTHTLIQSHQWWNINTCVKGLTHMLIH